MEMDAIIGELYMYLMHTVRPYDSAHLIPSEFIMASLYQMQEI